MAVDQNPPPSPTDPRASELRTFPHRRRPLVTAVVASALVLLAHPAAVPAATGGPDTDPAGTPELAVQVESDPDVQAARSTLDAAHARAAEASRRLDDLAATFETARGHAERLADELAGADDRVADAEEAVREAQAAHAEQVRAAYMQPGLDLVRVSGAFLLSPDVGSALHASAVMERVAANRSATVRSVAQAGREVLADIGNQRDIAGGTAASMRDVEDLSATFTQALEQAQAEVAAAEDALADAEADAEARLAAEAALSAAGVGVVGGTTAAGTVIATINGGTQEMACPLGQPNGFIDSWGFPRSGGRSHKGVDMFAAYGAPIYAAADGYVRRVFNNALGGLSIDTVDALGNRYYHAHLSAAYVVDGQSVQAGQLIGANGNSGNAIATPPHLHWQFHPADGGPVNPYPLAAALCR
ncbi:M23 family metallopeptidase [Euzebya sp.]|uniref:M23 family metallopeptidase n=1 Tax=Euzebya sp. TaxID=1971409 RepID=UPI0035192BC2